MHRYSKNWTDIRNEKHSNMKRHSNKKRKLRDKDKSVHHVDNNKFQTKIRFKNRYKKRRR